MGIVTATSENFQKEVLEAELAVVDFWASWCGSCKMFGPIFEDVANPVSYTHLDVYKRQGYALFHEHRPHRSARQQ